MIDVSPYIQKLEALRSYIQLHTDRSLRIYNQLSFFEKTGNVLWYNRLDNDNDLTFEEYYLYFQFVFKPKTIQ